MSSVCFMLEKYREQVGGQSTGLKVLSSPCSLWKWFDRNFCRWGDCRVTCSRKKEYGEIPSSRDPGFPSCNNLQTVSHHIWGTPRPYTDLPRLTSTHLYVWISFYITLLTCRFMNWPPQIRCDPLPHKDLFHNHSYLVSPTPTPIPNLCLPLICPPFLKFWPFQTRRKSGITQYLDFWHWRVIIPWRFT